MEAVEAVEAELPPLFLSLEDLLLESSLGPPTRLGHLNRFCLRR